MVKILGKDMILEDLDLYSIALNKVNIYVTNLI